MTEDLVTISSEVKLDTLPVGVYEIETTERVPPEKIYSVVRDEWVDPIGTFKLLARVMESNPGRQYLGVLRSDIRPDGKLIVVAWA